MNQTSKKDAGALSAGNTRKTEQRAERPWPTEEQVIDAAMTMSRRMSEDVHVRLDLDVTWILAIANLAHQQNSTWYEALESAIVNSPAAKVFWGEVFDMVGKHVGSSYVPICDPEEQMNDPKWLEGGKMLKNA